MKFCLIFEVAGPCRWIKYEHYGAYRRIMFLWFSLSWVPYKWTEFLDRLVWAIKQDDGSETICDACGKPITEDQKNVGHECDLHEWCAND